jgi:two-component system, cell cycle response regulator DivK
MSRVLMLDDAGLFRMLEASFAMRKGCEILRARDGSDILRKARESAPALILLDSGKFDVDGPECLQALKADPQLRAIPVLVVTTEDRAGACSGAGADATLTRPLAPGAMDGVLSSLGRWAQRGGPRRATRGWVRVVGPSGLRRGRLKDLSRTGLFLGLPEPIPLEEAVELAVRLPGTAGRRQLRLHGIVVRQVASDPDSHLVPGVGIHFTEMNPRDVNDIDAYVSQAPA